MRRDWLVYFCILGIFGTPIIGAASLFIAPKGQFLLPLTVLLTTITLFLFAVVMFYPVDSEEK